MWLVEQVLSYFLGKATKAIEDHAADVARDKARGEINDTNTKAYEDAVDRASSIKAATDLLNRVHRP